MVRRHAVQERRSAGASEYVCGGKGAYCPGIINTRTVSDVTKPG